MVLQARCTSTYSPERKLRGVDHPWAILRPPSQACHLAMAATGRFQYHLDSGSQKRARCVLLRVQIVLPIPTVPIAAAHQVWSMLEIYTHMDVARLCELNADSSLRAFNTDPWANPAERPGDISAREYA